MATLNIVVTAKQAPITTQMRRFDKGVEQLYYASLFSSNPSYAKRTEPWRSWLKAGFYIGSKGYPPEANEPDRATNSVRPNGKVLEVKTSTPNTKALENLKALLETIEGLRGSLAGKDDVARAKALETNTKVGQLLLKPVMDCLKRGGFRQEEIDSFLAMIERGLVALTDDEITKIQFSLN